ncbi:hypothetical protein BV898_02382 [Hypsibius exemplaris]|uniref:G-protein coupled receptors family 1 profile domain-containing protein n=1 Tax=Hypsibius exemplaris TaxID=2072580 RepID=A0A1W0X7Z0_HYPEX|nr:hypothetical protein BV898_02382 [Hypsibius exemplaris]
MASRLLPTNLTVNSSGNATFTRPPSVSVYISHHRSLIVWTVAVLTINLIGALANILTFIATLTYRPLRKSSSCLLLAHCILLDTFITVVTEIGAVLVTLFGDRLFPAHFCQAWGVFVFGPTFVGNWAHALLAFNRFVAATFPHQYRRSTARPVLLATIIIPWVISVVVNVFPVAGNRVRFEMMWPWAGCMVQPLESLAQQLVTSFGTYIPCLVTGMCYTSVLIRSRLSVRRRVGEGSRSTVLNQRYEVSKMLFACFLWYCGANFTLPAAVTFFPRLYFSSPLTQLAFKGLQYVSSAVNPVFFIAVSKNYRDGVILVMTCRITATNGAVGTRGMVTFPRTSQKSSVRSSTK